MIKTSKRELQDIGKAWVIISLAFAVIFSHAFLFGGNFFQVFSWQFLLTVGVALLTAGLGFLLHELAHKVVAQRYGCQAEFRAFDQMLFLALGLAILVGFLFAAPGAVMISGMVTRKENGHISLAGPATNYVLGMVFLLLTFLSSSLNWAFALGFRINLWLGLFNLLPFWNFDGKKIYHWNPWVWGAMVAFGGYFVFFWG